MLVKYVNLSERKWIASVLPPRGNAKFLNMLLTKRQKDSLFILFIYGRLSQPQRVTTGLFTKSNLAKVENNTKHAHFTNVKHNIIRKLVPSVLLSLKKKANKVRRCWYQLPLTVLVWLLFLNRSYHIKKIYKKEWTKTIANEKYYINL